MDGSKCFKLTHSSSRLTVGVLTPFCDVYFSRCVRLCGFSFRSVYTFSWIFRQRFFLFCIGFRQLLNASLWEGKTHSAQFKTHRRIHDAICVNVFISTFLFITQRSASRFQFSRINCFSLCNFHIIRWFLIFSVCRYLSHTDLWIEMIFLFYIDIACGLATRFGLWLQLIYWVCLRCVIYEFCVRIRTTRSSSKRKRLYLSGDTVFSNCFVYKSSLTPFSWFEYINPLKRESFFLCFAIPES